MLGFPPLTGFSTVCQFRSHINFFSSPWDCVQGLWTELTVLGFFSISGFSQTLPQAVPDFLLALRHHDKAVLLTTDPWPISSALQSPV